MVTCPECGTSGSGDTEDCPNCGLVFSHFIEQRSIGFWDWLTKGDINRCKKELQLLKDAGLSLSRVSNFEYQIANKERELKEETNRMIKNTAHVAVDLAGDLAKNFAIGILQVIFGFLVGILLIVLLFFVLCKIS